MRRAAPLLHLSLHPVTIDQSRWVAIGRGFDEVVPSKSQSAANTHQAGHVQPLVDDPFFSQPGRLPHISPVATGGLAGPHQLQIRAEGGIPADRVSSERTRCP